MPEQDSTAQKVAIVCANMIDIRRCLSSGPTGDAVLDDLVATARSGGDVTAAVNTLHEVLQAVTSDVKGLHAYGDNGRTDRGPHGGPVSAPGLRPGEPVFLCPANRCTRHWWPQGPVPVPRCAISGQVLRQDWL
ncbi:hypothetical protein [Streptomyces canus]|uniref:hypothetical protein n=1 Tax=Streptomyces canus TaxID=58343 RepID=UPI000AFA0E27|nr:hypothetical protein [Streptomyces canus]